MRSNISEKKKFQKFFAKMQPIPKYGVYRDRDAVIRGDCMNDEQIVKLYFDRNEAAITESKIKYGGYCMTIAVNILRDELDSEECVNDTWLGAWRSIPPKKPSNLAAYLGKITRNLSLNRYRMKNADKRQGDVYAVSLEELEACVPAGETIVEREDSKHIGASISDFLRLQKPLDRRVFVCRYFYCDAIADIARRFDISESRTKSVLFRMRSRLKLHLENDGITL